jgi:uncharacterized protein YbjQ (UPF0145 family)
VEPSPFWEVAIEVGPFVLSLVGAYLIGSWVERRHFANLRMRETRSRNFPLATFREVPAGWEVTDCQLVSGSCVISLDYFKRFVAGLRLLVGGRIPSYETLLDRARREAVLRMKESAHAAGYRAVIGMRLETAQVAMSRRSGGTAGVEVIAWGTALRLARE